MINHPTPNGKTEEKCCEGMYSKCDKCLLKPLEEIRDTISKPPSRREEERPRDKKITEALYYIENIAWQHNRKHAPENARARRENREVHYMQLRHALYDLVHDNKYEHERVARVLNDIFVAIRLQEIAGEENVKALKSQNAELVSKVKVAEEAIQRALVELQKPHIAIEDASLCSGEDITVVKFLERAISFIRSSPDYK